MIKDRISFIMKDMQNKYNIIKDKYEVFGMYLQGSQNYGLDIYSDEYKSDIDVKAIVIPTFEDIVNNKKPISTTLIMEDNSHIDVKDIRLMFNVFGKQNINFIEILFTEFYIINPKYQELAEELFNISDEVSKINWNASLRTMSGMSMEKYKALKHPYPSLIDRIEKYGFDCKQLHHIIRLNYFIEDFVVGKPYRECLVGSEKQREYLKFVKIPGNIKLGEAEVLALKYDTATRLLKEENILEDDKVNHSTIKKLNKIAYETIKLNFISQLK